MTRVLVVDDDPQLLRALRINLTARRYEVATAADGTTALTAAARTPPDLVILDLGLPDLDGVAVIAGPARLASRPDHRAVRPRHRDRQGRRPRRRRRRLHHQALRHGRAPRPHPRRPAPRRTRRRRRTTVSRPPTFTVDLAAKRVTTAAGEVRLTPTEWHMLEILVRHTGKLVTQKQLLHEVWGPAYETETNYLRVHLANLRRKTRTRPGPPPLPDHRTRHRLPLHPMSPSIAARVPGHRSAAQSIVTEVTEWFGVARSPAYRAIERAAASAGQPPTWMPGRRSRVGFVLADDLAGDGGGVAAAEQEVADHVHQRAAFGPGEVAVRAHAGGCRAARAGSRRWRSGAAGASARRTR